MKYIQLPDFTVDREWSAWEGETMHGVADLYSGTYCETYALGLMRNFIARYLHNASEAGADIEYHREELRKILSTPKPTSGDDSAIEA